MPAGASRLKPRSHALHKCDFATTTPCEYSSVHRDLRLHLWPAHLNPIPCTFTCALQVLCTPVHLLVHRTPALSLQENYGIPAEFPAEINTPVITWVLLADNFAGNVTAVFPAEGSAFSLPRPLLGSSQGSAFFLIQDFLTLLDTICVNISLKVIQYETFISQSSYLSNSIHECRFLSKAAVKTESPCNPWSLCSVTQVEETKQMLRMIPILISSFVPSTMVAQIHTLFIKQGATLDRRIGPHFRIPPASLTAFVTLSMLISVPLYDRAFVPFARRFTGNPRGISLLRRMAIGLFIHIVIMLVACLTERHRLSAAHGVESTGATVPLTVFILLPQFILMGVADAFLEVAKIEFFYDQAPEGMKSLGTSYAMTTLGVGNFLSSFLLSTTEKVTRRLDGGHGGWIVNNLNKSHLDYYYAFLAVLNVVNFFFFLFVSRFYVYKAEFNAEAEGVGESNEGKSKNIDVQALES